MLVTSKLNCRSNDQGIRHSVSRPLRYGYSLNSNYGEGFPLCRFTMGRPIALVCSVRRRTMRRSHLSRSWKRKSGRTNRCSRTILGKGASIGARSFGLASFTPARWPRRFSSLGKPSALFVGLYWLTGGMGICLGYHRLLTHGSFQTYRPVRWLFAFLGGLAGEGSAVIWVANHRKHHAHSDKEGDPHSPRDGGLVEPHAVVHAQLRSQVARRHGPALRSRLGERPDHSLSRQNISRVVLRAWRGILWTIGYVGWDSYTAWSFVVWGMFVRMVWVYHITWAVNSATHMWGYRNYETTDDSKNLWWVGLLAWGEGWHNNHHAYQRMARHGHKWWEIDLTYYSIWRLEKLGLAWNVVHKVPAWQKPE